MSRPALPSLAWHTRALRWCDRHREHPRFRDKVTHELARIERQGGGR